MLSLPINEGWRVKKIQNGIVSNKLTSFFLFVWIWSLLISTDMKMQISNYVGLDLGRSIDTCRCYDSTSKIYSHKADFTWVCMYVFVIASKEKAQCHKSFVEKC